MGPVGKSTMVKRLREEHPTHSWVDVSTDKIAIWQCERCGVKMTVGVYRRLVNADGSGIIRTCDDEIAAQVMES